MKENDELSQYQRRLCLRIHGIHLTIDRENESSDDCLQNIFDVFVDLVVHIPNEVIDRGHRLEIITMIKNKSAQTIIVWLAIFRHRTATYRAWKNFAQYTIKLDLAKP